ncbi:hypothetical protein LZ32DRAFT_503111, partial [Colletotrichum eremochloae]
MGSFLSFTILLFHLLCVSANTLQKNGYSVKVDYHKSIYKVYSKYYYDNADPITIVQFDEYQTGISILETYNQLEPERKGKLSLLAILRDLCDRAEVSPEDLEQVAFKMREPRIRQMSGNYIIEHPLKGAKSITIRKKNSGWKDFASTPFVQTAHSLVGHKDID